MGVSDFRVIANLSSTAFAAQLHTDLVDLAQTRGAHRLAIGETAAVGVDRQMAVNASCTVAQQLFLLAVFTEAILSHVNNFGAAVGVLQLDNIYVFGADSSELEGCFRRGHRRRISHIHRL